MNNIFDMSQLDFPLQDEHFINLLKSDNIKIQRIVSTGQKSDDNFWYDQDENEWVIVLEGKAILSVEEKNCKIVKHILNKGDYINLASHTKHRIDYTDKKNKTIWLAIFY